MPHDITELSAQPIAPIRFGIFELGFDPNEKRDKDGKWTDGGTSAPKRSKEYYTTRLNNGKQMSDDMFSVGKPETSK